MHQMHYCKKVFIALGYSKNINFVNFYIRQYAIKKVLLITAIPLLFAASCRKDSTRPCEREAFNFAVTSEWSPQKEVYNVGDTIFLNSSFPKTLVDLIGNYNVDYSNSVGIGGASPYWELDTILHEVKGATAKFNFVSITGEIGNKTINLDQSKSISFLEQSTKYELRVGIIVKQKGIFAIYIPDLTSNGLRGKNCTNVGFANTLTNTNKNLNLFQYAMNRPPASQFEIDRIYCFRVQ